MKLPSKVTSYKESIIARFPIILTKIKERDFAVSTLYDVLKDKITLDDYVDVLDCLYVLGQITLRKEIIHYVKRDSI